VALISPAGKKPGNGRLEITLVAVPPDMQAGFGKDDAAIMEYIAGAFLGITDKPKEQRSREFLGKPAAGAVYSSSVPKKRRIEMYLVQLKGGDKAAVAVTGYGSTPVLEMENVMSLFARTLAQRKSK